MNSASSFPSLKKLYWHDHTIRRAANACGFGLMMLAGVWWISRGPANPLSPEDAAFDAAMADWVFVGGVVMIVLGGVVLAWRHRWVKQVLSRGTRVKGMVDDLTTYTRETTDKTSGQRSRTHSHYAHLRYNLQGAERRVRLRLPGSGFTYNLVKGGETDLMVLESAPDKPLIRSVYCGRL